MFQLCKTPHTQQGLNIEACCSNDWNLPYVSKMHVDWDQQSSLKQMCAFQDFTPTLWLQGYSVDSTSSLLPLGFPHLQILFPLSIVGVKCHKTGIEILL